LKIVIDIAIIYYITQFKHPEISIFRNTAVRNTRKYQTRVIRFVQLGSGIEECFSDDKIQK
jgi:hypothetical protein